MEWKYKMDWNGGMEKTIKCISNEMSIFHATIDKEGRAAVYLSALLQVYMGYVYA